MLLFFYGVLWSIIFVRGDFVSEEKSFIEKILIGTKITGAAISTLNPLTNMIYQVYSAIEMNNLSDLVTVLNDKVKNLEEKEGIFITGAASERGEVFLKYSFQRAARFNRKEQIEEIVAIIITCFTSNIIDEDDAEILVDIVSDLSFREEMFYCGLYEKLIELEWASEEDRDPRESWRFDDPFFEVENRLDTQEQDPIYNRLIAKGLLTKLDTTSFFRNESDPLHKAYEFTKFGKLLAKILYSR